MASVVMANSMEVSAVVLLNIHNVSVKWHFK